MNHLIWYKAKCGDKMATVKLSVGRCVSACLGENRKYLDREARGRLVEAFNTEKFVIVKVWMEACDESVSVTWDLPVLGQGGV